MFFRSLRYWQVLLPVLTGTLMLCAFHACAQEPAYTPALTGPLGLNTIPSARMDEAGTIRLGVSTLDPYVHTFAGMQIADPLYIGLRQTAEISSLFDSADHLYPGMDIKLRLLREGPHAPEIALGLQSALGHKRMAGEYLALSKHLGDFDFTVGLGWGRFGSAGHVNNPLRFLGAHFGGNRDLDGDNPNEPSDWFTGRNVGIFGGLEYFTPFDGLSVKLDYSADRYKAEQASFGFDAPAPWSAGLSYQPANWINAGLALQGTDKIMARLTLQSNPRDWPFTGRDETASVHLTDTAVSQTTASANLHLSPFGPAPKQLGRAASELGESNPQAQALDFQLISLGLRGPNVRLMTADLQHAHNHNGSPQEIWRNTEFTQEEEEKPKERKAKWPPLPNIWLTQDNQFSLAEEDTGLLYRSSLIAEARAPEIFEVMTLGAAFRLNLADNLERIGDLRPRALLPVRSDVDRFADRTIGLERLYAASFHTLSPQIHTGFAAGYLEEMVAGFGGEIIVRPFESRFAFGAEAWEALRRDPQTALNLGLNGDHVLTAHLNAWYDWPGQDITLFLQAGRYLAEDVGFTAGLEKDFANGAQLKGFITLTDNADLDAFGNQTHAYHGISLSLPLGSVPYIPDGSTIKFRAQPFGRDTGQSVNKPFDLYALTQPLTLNHMAKHWQGIVE